MASQIWLKVQIPLFISRLVSCVYIDMCVCVVQSFNKHLPVLTCLLSYHLLFTCSWVIGILDAGAYADHFRALKSCHLFGELKRTRWKFKSNQAFAIWSNPWLAFYGFLCIEFKTGFSLICCSCHNSWSSNVVTYVILLFFNIISCV